MNPPAGAAEGPAVSRPEEGQELEEEDRTGPGPCGFCSLGDGLPGDALGFRPGAPCPLRLLSRH